MLIIHGKTIEGGSTDGWLHYAVFRGVKFSYFPESSSPPDYIIFHSLLGIFMILVTIIHYIVNKGNNNKRS